MKTKQKLREVLLNRISELKKAKAEGKKVVGYYPSEYMPEELVLASGAIPLGLAKGGDNAAVENAGPYLPRWLDTFCRAQVGYIMMKYDPHYEIIDLYMMPIVDVANNYCVSALECFTKLDTFKFEVPHEKTKRGLEYYLNSISRFKEKLEKLTGNKITEDRLREAIKLCNRERVLLREISLLRKKEEPPISGLDFAKLTHASYVADKATYVKLLEDYLEELKRGEPIKIRGPRILLTGSTLASGDYKIHNSVIKLGGDIVIEQYSEGLRDYWQDVSLEGDLMENLAERYFMKKVAHGVFTPSRERLDFVVDLAKDFKVNGVIWYQTMYRDAFDYEAIYFPDILKEKTGLSMLKLETDYDPTETGAFRTRIEAYFEIIGN